MKFGRLFYETDYYNYMLNRFAKGKSLNNFMALMSTF
jgi:hypothetical protein